jgi:hypothetical protein
LLVATGTGSDLVSFPFFKKKKEIWKWTLIRISYFFVWFLFIFFTGLVALVPSFRSSVNLTAQFAFMLIGRFIFGVGAESSYGKLTS